MADEPMEQLDAAMSADPVAEAVLAERKQCIGEACAWCKLSYPVERVSNLYWEHPAHSADSFAGDLTPLSANIACRAWQIHERDYQEKQQ